MFLLKNKKLNKWIFSEFFGPFFAVLLGFLLFAILAMDLYQMIDLVSSKQVPILVIFHMLFLRLPFWIVFALPVSLLFFCASVIIPITVVLAFLFWESPFPNYCSLGISVLRLSVSQ